MDLFLLVDHLYHKRKMSLQVIFLGIRNLDTTSLPRTVDIHVRASTVGLSVACFPQENAYNEGYLLILQVDPRLCVTIFASGIPENRVLGLCSSSQHLGHHVSNTNTVEKKNHQGTYQSQGQVNASRPNGNLLTRRPAFNHSRNVLRRRRRLCRSRTGCLVRARVRHIAHREEVRVRRVCELHGGLHADEAILWVEEWCLCGEALEELGIGRLACGLDDKVGGQSATVLQAYFDGRAGTANGVTTAGNVDARAANKSKLCVSCAKLRVEGEGGWTDLTPSSLNLSLII